MPIPEHLRDKGLFKLPAKPTNMRHFPRYVVEPELPSNVIPIGQAQNQQPVSQGREPIDIATRRPTNQ